MSRPGRRTFLKLAAGAAGAIPFRSWAGQNPINTPPEGFQALFNGRNLEGWQGSIKLPEREKLSPEQRMMKQMEIDAKVLPHWSVVDGVLAYDGKGNSIQTDKDYGDFELHLDWKIGEKGDSGIYVRGNPQIQIWDAKCHPEGSGGLFNNQMHPNKPLKRADKPVGEWNRFRIVMKGDRVTVWLNGVLVVESTPLENYWERGKPLPATGPIEIQHHGKPLWFRSLYLRELS